MLQEILGSSVGGGASSFQFSTEEQKTNLKWIDGKDIYTIVRKTSNVAIPTTAGDIPTELRINVSNLDTLIDAQVLFKEASYKAHISAQVTESRWKSLDSWNATSGREVCIIYYYTKTS